MGQHAHIGVGPGVQSQVKEVHPGSERHGHCNLGCRAEWKDGAGILGGAARVQEVLVVALCRDAGVHPVVIGCRIFRDSGWLHKLCIRGTDVAGRPLGIGRSNAMPDKLIGNCPVSHQQERS